MDTPLMKVPLKALMKRPVMFDANILMVGIERRTTDTNYSFENIRDLYLIPVFESFQNILIHEMVYQELDEECKKFVDSYHEKVKIVKEDNLYGADPQYTTIFNNISRHDRVQYDRRSSKDRGEVYSLSYAAFHKINYFSSKEIMVDDIANDLTDLKDVQIITFDIIVLLAYIYHNSKNNTSHNKSLKAMYKTYCEDVIKRHKLPPTLREYVVECVDYL